MVNCAPQYERLGALRDPEGAMNTHPMGAESHAAALKKDLYEIGEIPPVGHVPASMYAWVVRKDRHGPPEQSMQVEVVPTWTSTAMTCSSGDGCRGQLQRRLGGARQPVSRLTSTRTPITSPAPTRPNRLGRRLQVTVEGRRRGCGSLQPGRRRRRRVQRRRPLLRLATHLGL